MPNTALVDNFDRVKDQITEDRIRDLHGYFIESLSENPQALRELSEAILSGDNLRAGDIVSDAVYRYCSPTDEEVTEAMQ